MTKGSLRRWMIGTVLLTLATAGSLAWRSWKWTAPEKLVQRGNAAIRAGEWTELLRSADGLRGQAAFAAEEQLFRGIYLLKTGSPAAALRELSRLDPVGPIREPALLAAGEALYQQNQFADAGRLFATLAAEQPGHVEAHRWLGAIAYDLGDMNRAMDEMDIVIRLAPADHRPHILKGQMLFDLERFADAATEYSLAIDAAPPATVLEEVFPTLARCHMANREYPAALAALTRAPRTALRLSLEAGCQLSLGDAAAARQLLLEAQELNPEQPEMLRLLGQMELDAGHLDQAEGAFRAVLAGDPQDHETRHQLAQALRLAGRSAEADEEARSAARTIELKTQLSQLTLEAMERPQDFKVREQMARLCDELGKPQLATLWRNAAIACQQANAAPVDSSPEEHQR